MVFLKADSIKYLLLGLNPKDLLMSINFYDHHLSNRQTPINICGILLSTVQSNVPMKSGLNIIGPY